MSRFFWFCFILNCANLSLAGDDQSPHLSEDPYSQIEFFYLSNGLEVILAPSSTARTVKVNYEVDVGYGVEDDKNLGVSHLLEHVLFRHPHLSSNMSFLEVIQEKGGQANGITSRRETSYFATVPSKAAEWVVEVFAKMMLNREIQEKDLEKSRREVQLEIGESQPINQFFGFDIIKWIKFDYLNTPSFYEYNFGTDLNRRFYTDEENRLANQRITLKQIQDHYDQYYYPENARLYITGAFIKEIMKKKLQLLWEEKSFHPIKRTLPKDVFSFRDQPYIVHDIISEGVPHLQIGSLLYGLTYSEEVAIAIYIQYLANELMKEVRNELSQTYTVVPQYFFENGIGFTSVDLEIPREDYQHIVEKIRDIFALVSQKGINEEQLNKARERYLNKLRLIESDSESIHILASEWRNFRQRYGVNITSPFIMAQQLSLEQMNSALMIHLDKNKRMEILTASNLFFRYDNWILGFLISLLGLSLMRWKSLKPFNHSGVRWVRKVRYPSLKLVEISAFVIAVIVFSHVKYIFEVIIPTIIDLRQILLFNGYFLPWAESLSAIFILGMTFSCYPRKLMVENGSLLVKSLTFYSYRIPLGEIERVEIKPYLKYLFSKESIRCFTWRHFIFHPFLWQKALFVVTKNKTYIFSIKDAGRAANELNKMIKSYKKKYFYSLAQRSLSYSKEKRSSSF